MTAKVIKTGVIVNVVRTGGGWVADFGNSIRHYADSELDFEFADWEKFRREAAKTAMLGILAGRKTHQGIQETAEYAIQYADELIKQLREDKK